MIAGGSRCWGREAAAGTSDLSATTAEEEALKRNTDCIYYLACPLTCKKGNECEYRHSEGARVNPRNCWYWLNASCLNPKCSFRHLPFDGIYGSQGETSGLAQPSLKTAPAMHDSGAHISAYNVNKQSVPCYYFQKGGCFKGDRCPFMHGPPPAGTSQSATYSLPPQAAKALTEQRPPHGKDSCSLKECAIQCPKLGAEVSTDAPLQSKKSTIDAEPSISNSVPPKKSISPFAVDVEIPKTQVSHNLSTSNDTPNALQNLQLNLVDEQQNGIESDEFLPESSPGFDVLVDGEHPDYFHNEDEYGGRKLNSMDDFDYHHSDYESVPQFERDRSNLTGEYEHDERVHSRCGWKRHRRSSERVSDRSLYDREREEAVRHINGSDLRLQLLKQRRLNGSRSVTSPEHSREAERRDDRSSEDRYGRGSEREWQQHQERSSISSRLRGRITLPKRSSPDPPVDYQYEKERDRLRHQRRLSPALPTSNYQRKYQDRLRRRLNDEQAFSISSIHQEIKKDDADSALDFAGPKSLAELKAEKNAESYHDHVVKEHRNVKSERVIIRHEPERSLSFEGPKPLSVILKRKQETGSGNTSAYSGSGDEEDNKDEGTDSGVPVANSNVHSTRALEAHHQPEGHLEEEEEGLICLNAEKLNGPSALKDEQVVEDVMIVYDMEDNYVDNTEHKDEFDYSGVYFKTDDEFMHQDEDLEDEDEFARKIGLILS